MVFNEKDSSSCTDSGIKRMKITQALTGNSQLSSRNDSVAEKQEIEISHHPFVRMGDEGVNQTSHNTHDDTGNVRASFASMPRHYQYRSSFNKAGQRRRNSNMNWTYGREDLHRQGSQKEGRNSSISMDHINGGFIEDQTPEVENFFGSIRIPASFLAATSFSQMFVTADEHNNSEIQRQLQTACLTCQGFTFLLSMNVIVLSSSALVRILTKDFDAFAENAYEMLFREFHYEFVSIRWSFNISLYGFLVAVTLKILYEFELFNFSINTTRNDNGDDDGINSNGESYGKERMELGIAVVLLMVAFYLHLSSYVNSTLVGWSNQYSMTMDLVKMLFQRCQESIREPLSLGFAFLGILFLVLALIPGAQI